MSEQEYIKSVFDWEHFICYLAGPIECDPEGCRKWREDFTERLVKIGFKRSQILSPTKKPVMGKSPNLDDEGALIKQFRDTEDWDGLCNLMSQIVHTDLRLTDLSSLVIAYFPVDKNNNRINTYGTLHEIVVARWQRKPVMVVWPAGGKKTCSAWLMWLIGHDNVFENFEELETRLRGLSQGEVAYNAKDWLLINYHKKRK